MPGMSSFLNGARTRQTYPRPFHLHYNTSHLLFPARAMTDCWGDGFVLCRHSHKSGNPGLTLDRTEALRFLDAPAWIPEKNLG